jgi:hypothetical protein
MTQEMDDQQGLLLSHVFYKVHFNVQLIVSQPE